MKPSVLFSSLLASFVIGAAVMSIWDGRIAEQQTQDQEIHQAQAREATEAAKKADEGLTVALTDLDIAKKRVDDIKAKLDRVPIKTQTEERETPPANGQEELEHKVQLQQELIDAQTSQIKGLEAALRSSITRGDQWQKAAKAEESRAIQAEAALAARKGIEAGIWRGRIEGFALGVACALAADRMR